MKNSILILLIGSLVSNISFAQNRAVEDIKFDKQLKKLLDFSVPTITVDEFWNIKDDVIILDAREKEEFKTSHIKNAQYIGYDQIDYAILRNISKQDTIVLYCSVGYRSEKVANSLKKKGFINVMNLYGSIFEWVNRDFPVVDEKGNQTYRVHTYNKRWSKWIHNPLVIKYW